MRLRRRRRSRLGVGAAPLIKPGAKAQALAGVTGSFTGLSLESGAVAAIIPRDLRSVEGTLVFH
jgi:hypothetical protein